MPEAPTARAALYARVSTGHQDPENQVDKLREYIARRGWKRAEEFVDVGTGLSATQPQLQRALRGAWRHEFDILVLWSLDRFGRDLREIIDHVDDLSKLGVSVLSYSEQFDFSSSTGKLQLAVFAWAAEFERKRIKERVHLGLERARALGKRLGRPRSKVDEERIRADYQALRSERKVAVLHHCSDTLVHQIVHFERKLIPREIRPKSPTQNSQK